ncbi:MAG TPA: ABC transporter substrate-binding protein [Acidimicrobiia bacterium]|nr:ABC transporter substrate-binding protein [Acidimicrobiia bacterium]
MKSRIRCGLLAALVVVACGGSTSGDDELKDVTFMAGFAPQANLPFVGAYVAKDRGFFAEEGLDVTIEHSAGGGEHLQLLAAGEVDVTTQDAAVLLQRRADPGLPLVSIALIGQRGQQAFVALADSGIESPADWPGHTVGYKGTPPPDLFAILDAVGVDREAVELVNVGFDPRILTEGQVDVYPVFKSNEPDTLAGWGFDFHLWDAADYGVPTLGLAYVATEGTVASDPVMLEGFTRAVIRGIEFARDEPEAAVDIVMGYVGEDADRDHQLFMLEMELVDAESEVTGEHGIGWQTTEQWQALHDLLVEYDALSGPIEVADAFTTAFLP